MYRRTIEQQGSFHTATILSPYCHRPRITERTKVLQRYGRHTVSNLQTTTDMAELEDNFLGITGHVGNVTIYKKNGKYVVRKAKNRKSHSMTRRQFIQRQRMAHNITLWKMLSLTKELYFQGDNDAYRVFLSVNTFTPVPFFTKREHANCASLLMPGMAISEGPAPSIDYRLGEADGMPALLTNLPEMEARQGRLVLYVLEQLMDYETPRLHVTAEGIRPEEVRFIDGNLVLVGDRYANTMLGFGLVHLTNGCAAPQCIVTRCTLYEQYTTEEALHTAAKSYKGLTER